MIVYNNEKIIDTKKDNIQILGGKDEGLVFGYDNSVIKIYDDKPNKTTLTEDMVRQMANVKTKRILMPTNPIYIKENSEKIYKGFARFGFIKKCIPLSAMWETLGENLEAEGKLIEQDVQTLTANNIKINDLTGIGNLLYNGSLYFCDPGSFEITNDKTVASNNKEELKAGLHYHLFLLSTVKEYLEDELCRITESNFTLSDDFYNFLLNVYGNVYDTIDYSNYFSFLEDVLAYYGTIEEYKREILEQAIDDDRYSRYSYEMEELERVLRR